MRFQTHIKNCLLSLSRMLTGFPRLLENSGKSWNFYWKISRTWKCFGKWPWYWKVLEIYLQLPGMSWKLLGDWCRWQFLASIRHVSAEENSHNWTAGMKNAFAAGALPQTPLEELRALPQIPQMLIVAIFKHCRLMTWSWINASGVPESPGIYCNQESGNPVLTCAQLWRIYSWIL